MPDPFPVTAKRATWYGENRGTISIQFHSDFRAFLPGLVDRISLAGKKRLSTILPEHNRCWTRRCHVAGLFLQSRKSVKKNLHKVFSEKFLPGDPKNFPDSLLPVFLKPGKKYIYTGDAGHAAGFLSLSGSAIADHR